ncbi:hypothetical protein L226DRAFT_563665 [Lentinus tigrinus ALCF2SS1-7]|uniref:uncharacterized protein n=1 Tax=Lentinus tigrinus ALCF2SS1-7 TaxID=1328758 RepID=UPI001165E8E3|nr:hypothetical protein L226DRAFT_563665 [Lentinus tigrinus ALCF2SS1-7]
MSVSHRAGYSRLPQSPVDARRSILTTSTLDPEIIEEIEVEEDAHVPVATVQAAEHVFTSKSTIGLASYVYSLDNQTTSNYLAFATSYFGSHSLISSIQVAQSILDGSDAELVWTQILQGGGGGFAAVCSAVGAQASVPHADVAMVIALVLLWTEIGAGVGGSVAGAIWSGIMPGKLREYLPGLSEDEREALFGSITDVRARPLGDPVRQGVISAYSDTMKTMLVLATALSVIPLLLSLLMPNWYLGDQQNAVEDPDLDPDYDRGHGEEELLDVDADPDADVERVG